MTSHHMPCIDITLRAKIATVRRLWSNDLQLTTAAVSLLTQLLEINFMSNLNTKPELKQEIDHIMGSVRLEE